MERRSGPRFRILSEQVQPHGPVSAEGASDPAKYLLSRPASGRGRRRYSRTARAGHPPERDFGLASTGKCTVRAVRPGGTAASMEISSGTVKAARIGIMEVWNSNWITRNLKACVQHSNMLCGSTLKRSIPCIPARSPHSSFGESAEDSQQRCQASRGPRACRGRIG